VKIGGEVVVGKSCIDCGELIVSDDENGLKNKLWHPACYRIHKRSITKKHYVPKEHFQFTCRLCNNTFESSEINQYGKQCICKSCKAKIRSPNSVVGRDVTAAVTCLGCDALIISSTAIRKYCDDCVDAQKVKLRQVRTIKKMISDTTSLSPKEKYDKARDWLNSNLGDTIKEQKAESLGTYSTTKRFKENDPNHIHTHKDGEPDFEHESKFIGMMKKETYRFYPRKYTVTEADIIRDATEHKDKN